MGKIKIQALGPHNAEAVRLHEILLHLQLTGKDFSKEIGYLRPDQIYRVLKS